MIKEINIRNKDISFTESTIAKDYYKDRYPEGIDLHPDSDDHKKLLQFINNSVKRSYDVMSKRYPDWKKIDEKLTVYIDLDDADKAVQDNDPSKPVAIVVPISYATRETLLTYMMAAFMKHPLFQYEPSQDPDDLIKTVYLESIIAHHCIKSKVGLDLYTHWSDAFTYGFGAAGPMWIKEDGFRTNKETGLRDPIVLFEGSALRTFDPYNFFPDTNVPVTKVKDMQEVSWLDRTSFNTLLREEQVDRNTFNVLFIKKMADKSSTFFNANDTETGRYSKTGISFGSGISGTNDTGTTDVLTTQAWIIPADFNLSPLEYPEHWTFRLSADRIIIGARPSNLDHGQHAVTTTSPDTDGHTTIPLSLLEREFPMQHAIDWLWKSHVANVRKTMNNMFLVDPSQVNMNDFTDTRFGLLARLRAAAWGKDVKGALMQIPVQDATKNNIADIGFLMQVDSKVFTSDQAKGFQERRGERVSATEAGDTRSAFLSKMEKMAKIMAMQSHYDIANQFGHNTIQFLKEEQVVKLLGNYKDKMIEIYNQDFDFLKVDPTKIDMRFDVVAQDGNIPNGEHAETWERLMSLASQFPEVYQNIDLTKVWFHTADLLGAKNVQDFKKRGMTTSVQPDQAVADQAAAGNIVTPDQLESSQNLKEV